MLREISPVKSIAWGWMTVNTAHGDKTLLIEPKSKLWVPLVHVIWMWVAPIKLYIINIPTCEGVSIFLQQKNIEKF